MDSTWDPWLQSPSGSRAEANETPWPDELPGYDVFGVADNSAEGFEADFPYDSIGQEDDSNEILVAHTYGADLAPGQLMSTKVPPAWNGRGSWLCAKET